MKALTFVEDFLFKRFGEMPRGVRVIAYLSLLLVWIYGYLAPRFIYGECFTPPLQPGGKKIPCVGVYVHLDVEGQTIESRMNQNGVWAIPIPSRLPGATEINFAVLDPATKELERHAVWIPWWTLLTGARAQVIAEHDPLRFSIASGEGIVRRSLALLGHMVDAGNAEAQPLFMDEETRVKEIVARVAHTDIGGLASTTTLDELRLRTIQRWELVHDLQQEFKVSILPEEWDDVKTVGDIVRIIKRKRQR